MIVRTTVCNRMILLTRVAALLAAAVNVADAFALETNPNAPHVQACLRNASMEFTIDKTALDVKDTATLRWKVRQAPGCFGYMISVDRTPVMQNSGSMTVQPAESSSYTLRYHLPGSLGRTKSVKVAVNYPSELYLDCSTPSCSRILAAALKRPGMTVRLADHVQLDMSGISGMTIAQDVSLLGGRAGLNPGPLIFTRKMPTDPKQLFIIGGDNVKISGIRVRGESLGITDNRQYSPVGIAIYSNANVDMGNNEIFGWGGSGISVNDGDQRLDMLGGNCNANRSQQVHIHDNYIHHNQRYRGFGYGVVVGYGAYACIEHNVFDYNRHAIASDGRPNTGYFAQYNLVLENGGVHLQTFPIGTLHTHQFDMHGRDSCGIKDWFSDSVYNCGPAGEYMEIRGNTFLYTNDNAFKLRGTPSISAYVVGNQFAHSKLGKAVDQTETGLVTEGNVLKASRKFRYATCDIDADNIPDQLWDTGITRWYRSGLTMPWAFVDPNSKLGKRAKAVCR